MNRAYSIFEIKSVDGDQRTFQGIATTPATDRMADIVDPKGAEFKLPLPLLWQHDSKDPIGWVRKATVTDKGIEIEGEIADILDDGPLKDRLKTAWQMIKAGLVRGLSIGFNPIEYSEIKGTWGLRFTKWEWLELSAVTIPANQEATILAVKQFSRPAASGKAVKLIKSSPGASGCTSVKLIRRNP
ncbi:MAG: peptidase U35 [Lentisphaerae bacterium]|nr:peptidase U35 [Lentisphaerota bacterium]